MQTRALDEWMKSRMKHMRKDETFERTIKNGLADPNDETAMMLRWINDRNSYYEKLKPLVDSGEILRVNIADDDTETKMTDFLGIPISVHGHRANAMGPNPEATVPVDVFLERFVDKDDWQSDWIVRLK